MSRQYYAAFIGYQYDNESQVCRNRVEVCQRRRSNISMGLCVPVEDVRGRPRLRSASTRCISLPRVQTSTGQRSFAYSGPAVWNNLPPALHENVSLAAFKLKLTKYLFSRSQ